MFRFLKQALSGALFGTLIATQALGQATLLPNAKQQFFTPQGIPAASGTVDMYVPSTNTRKTTWKTSTESVGNQNTNPVLLDAGGYATIYGDGSYRQVVKDADGNTIWDAVTASTGGGSGPSPGPTVGDGNIVGTILPWAGLVAPPNYVFAYGQAIVRTQYPLFVATVTITTSLICTSGLNVLSGIADTSQIRIGAPVEASCVAPGTTVTAVATNSVTVSNNAAVSTAITAVFFPYGNGDGSTTLNVPDLRGQTLAGRNNMGGTASSALTAAFFGAQGPNSLGAMGGAQSTVLLLANLPPITPAGTITNGTITTTITNSNNGGDAIVGTSANSFSSSGSSAPFYTGAQPKALAASTQATSTFAGSVGGGSSTAFSTIQPTTTMNYVIKVLPDASTTVATGVASLGGMTGVIACGAGLTCGSQTISLSGVSFTPITSLIVSPANGGNISQTLSVAPSYTGPDGNVLAFNGDFSHTVLPTLYHLTGPALGQPATGFQWSPAATPFQTVAVLDASAGWNQSTSDNNGRTGFAIYRALINHGGQGDASPFYGNCQLTGSLRSGATNFLAAAGCQILSGDVGANFSGGYITGVGDINLSDNGFDAAAIGDVRNFLRTINTAALGEIWMGYRIQSNGTKAIDVGFSISGLATIGLDTTLAVANSSGNTTALNMAQNQRIYYNSSACAIGGINWYGCTLGNTYSDYNSSISAWEVVNSSTTLRLFNGGVSTDGYLLVTGGPILASYNSAGTFPPINNGVAIERNFTNSNNEIDFINTITGATKSFRWYQQTGASAVTLLMDLTTAGALTLGTKTITLGGDLTTSGAFNSTFTMTGATAVTFPTTGTLATTTATTTINGTTCTLTGSCTVTAAAGTLTGTTLNSTVVNSSLLNASATFTAGALVTASDHITVNGYVLANGSILTNLDRGFGGFNQTSSAGTSTMSVVNAPGSTTCTPFWVKIQINSTNYALPACPG